MRVFRRSWFQIFVAGVILLFLIERTLVATANPIRLPSVILFGAFLVSITFTTYLYASLPERKVSPLPLAICFFGGGVIGAVVAGITEYDVLGNLGLFVFPKVCSAMGFVALETMGCGFVVLLKSRGNLATLNEVLQNQGLNSPSGLAA